MPLFKLGLVPDQVELEPYVERGHNFPSIEDISIHIRDVAEFEIDELLKAIRSFGAVFEEKNEDFVHIDSAIRLFGFQIEQIKAFVEADPGSLHRDIICCIEAEKKRRKK